MPVRFRPMRPDDVHECVGIVAAHPIVGPRYGDAIADLGTAWLKLLYTDGVATSAVLEEVNGAAPKKLAVGISVFVTDEFLREVKMPPSFWVGPELATRVACGQSPLLTPAQAREANARGGLNVLVWEVTVRPEAGARQEVMNTLMMAFHQYHRGFRMKEIASQAEGAINLLGMRNTGGLLWNTSDGGYREFWQDDLNEIVRKPHLTGMTRELALAQNGSWLGSLFLLYQPPQIGFSRSEQRLLLSAMNGSTDQELSDEMAVSLATVKKTWRSIYDRVAVRSPELVPGNANEASNRRGKEKKQRLIAYLREHLEELRPVSRKALQTATSQTRELMVKSR